MNKVKESLEKIDDILDNYFYVLNREYGSRLIFTQSLQKVEMLKGVRYEWLVTCGGVFKGEAVRPFSLFTRTVEATTVEGNIKFDLLEGAVKQIYTWMVFSVPFDDFLNGGVKKLLEQ